MQAKGFAAFEIIGVSYVSHPTDPSANVRMRTGQVFKMLLWEGSSGKAVASADYWRGRLTLYVTYSDPPGGTGPVKVRVGEFGPGGCAPHGMELSSHKEDQDNLAEVSKSCPEGWDAFCARLPDVLVAADVMES